MCVCVCVCVCACVGAEINEHANWRIWQSSKNRKRCRDILRTPPTTCEHTGSIKKHTIIHSIIYVTLLKLSTSQNEDHISHKPCFTRISASSTLSGLRQNQSKINPNRGRVCCVSPRAQQENNPCRQQGIGYCWAMININTQELSPTAANEVWEFNS